MKLSHLVMLTACLLTLSGSGLADSILVGTNIASPGVGAGLCPSVADCEIVAEQFTLAVPVVVDQIKVVIDGPGDPLFDGSGSFNVSLHGTSFSETGSLAFTVSGPAASQVFSYGGLDIPLGPGTYYVVVSGGNLAWASASALATSAGTIGDEFSCDPTIRSCGNPGDSSWNAIDAPRAVEIDGTVVPEPSSWLLVGTGLLAVCCVLTYRMKASVCYSRGR